MNNKIEKNYIYNLIYQMVVLLIPIVTTPYLSRTLGPEAIGTYTYIISIVTYFNLLGSLGMAMYSQREIAYVQENKIKRSKIFFEIFILRAITISISMILFLLVFINNEELNKYYNILLLDMFITIFDTSSFFYGMEKMKTIVKAHFSIRIFIIACIFLFVKQPSDLIKFLVINVLANFCGNITLLLNLPKYICKVNIKDLNLVKHLKPTLILFIPQIATQIYTVLDKTMLGAMVSNKAELGFYEQAEKTVKIFLNIITALGIVMAPRIANQYSKKEYEGIKKDITNSLNFVYFLSIPMIFGILAIAKDFVLLFLGNDFYKSISIIYVLSPILLIIGIGNVVGMQYLFPTKKQLQYNISVIFGAIINLILNFILIPRMLSIGAAIATVFAELTVTGIQIYFIRKEFNIRNFLIMSFKYIIAALFMYITITLLNKLVFLNLLSILRIIIDVVIGSGIYIILLILLKDKIIKQLINRITGKNINFKIEMDYNNINMNSSDKIAILMCTYNGEKYLREQIESILNQTYQNFVLYIRDDNSTDSTKEIISYYTKKYDGKIVEIVDDKIAHSASKNFMFLLDYVYKLNIFDIFMFSDQDDYWEKDKIEVVVDEYQKISNKEIPILIHTDLTVVDSELNIINKSFLKYSNFSAKRNKFIHYLIQNNVTGCTMLINKNLINLIDFDIEYIKMHDWYFALIASSLGKVIFINKSTIKYRQHANNVLGAKYNRGIKWIYNIIKDYKTTQKCIKGLFVQADSFKKSHFIILSNKNKKVLSMFLKFGIITKNWKV